jgi:diaminopimelate decarboxylase
MSIPQLVLFPHTARVSRDSHLIIGGCDTVELAATFGTPLYIFDETTLRDKCAEFRREFQQPRPDTLVLYACKAFINSALARLFQEEGLGLDVVSAGELAIARGVGFPAARVYFHGNNKSREELELALDWGVGQVVVDNLSELHWLSQLCAQRGARQRISLRLSPGIDPHTHRHITTGVVDSKFGFPISTGQAEEAVAQALTQPALDLIGLHFHLGSLIFELEPYSQAIGIVLGFAAAMEQKYGLKLQELNVGGGFAVQYTLDSPAPALAAYARTILSSLEEHSRRLGLEPPRLVVEPGRAIVGQAGVALYRVGGQKLIPGVRHYIFVDGGMADNIRPALYGARYQALVANKADYPARQTLTIGGKFCESADILIRDIELPAVEEGDLIAIPTCGAYCLSMASNYNASLKPAIVLVREGQAHLIRRRETYEDLTRLDLIP